MRRILAIVVLFHLALVSCGGDDLEDANGEPTVEVPTVEVPAVPTTAAPTPTVVEPVQVDTFFDGEGPRDATVVGFLLGDEGGTRMCGVLMESFPPQCGGMWLVLANPESVEAEFDETQGIRWTPGPVVLDVWFDGDRLFNDDGTRDLWLPTPADRALVEGFLGLGVEWADADLPLADEIALGLGSEIITTIDVADAAELDTWDIDRAEFQGYAGPFNARRIPTEVGLAGEVTITVGPHARCAAPPVRAPLGYEEHRRVSVQPANATSCLEWWTIDFFLDDSGVVAAVTLDLFGP